MSDVSTDIWHKAVADIIANDNARMADLESAWRKTTDEEAQAVHADTPATLADVWNCYRLLLNRAPDPIGAQHHLDSLRAGISIHTLVKHFLFSQEHSDRYYPPAAKPEGAKVVRVNGLDLHLPAARTRAERAIRETGRHKPHLAGAIAAVLQPGMYVLDIGAGAGEFAVHAARKIGPDGRVVALEPNPDRVRALLANVAAHANDRVDVLPFAAADGDGFVTLVETDGIASARDATIDDLTAEGGAPLVYARTLDSIIPLDQRIDFIMIALDGFDHRALQGATGLLSRWQPHLIGEYAPALLRDYSDIDPIAYLRALTRAGYRRFTGLSPASAPIDVGSDIEALALLPAKLKTDRINFYAWSA